MTSFCKFLHTLKVGLNSKLPIIILQHVIPMGQKLAKQLKVLTLQVKFSKAVDPLRSCNINRTLQLILVPVSYRVIAAIPAILTGKFTSF